MPKIGWQSDLHGKMNLNLMLMIKDKDGVAPLITDPPLTSSMFVCFFFHNKKKVTCDT